MAESRRTETRYRTSDDEDLVGSGEAEGSAIDLDPPRRTDSKKTSELLINKIYNLIANKNH